MRGAGGGFTFSQVPTADIPRSTFNRSHGHKTTFDADYLIPFYVDEVLPGDTFRVEASIFARLSTPIVPIMDNVYLDVFFFFVPNRLVWANWQRFMGEQDSPADSVSYVVPTITNAGVYTTGSLGDYFGIPTGITGIVSNALFFRAYNLIWHQWFRDENMQNSPPISRGDGPDPVGDYVLLKRGKRHDYFTSCLPWPQKGPGVNLPLGTSAPVVSSGTGKPQFSATNVTNQPINVSGGPGSAPLNVTASGAASGQLTWATTNLVADLTNATAATINSLRQAFQIQKLLERDARGGTRYIEILRSHFGVVSPDARLQRPEYLGGGTVNVNVNPVVQTSATSAQPSPKGSLGAYALAGGNGLGFSKSFTEHGMLLGLVAARADLSYQQGMHKMFTRSTKVDFYWPALAHLGEQAVLNREIYAQGTAADDVVFGYQERWAEYRYYPSKITGKFRSTSATPLDFWHLAEKFTSAPVLNNTFIQSNTPMTRVLAVTTEPHFIFDSYIKMQCTRPMPTYSVPGLIDHF